MTRNEEAVACVQTSPPPSRKIGRGFFLRGGGVSTQVKEDDDIKGNEVFLGVGGGRGSRLIFNFVRIELNLLHT